MANQMRKVDTNDSKPRWLQKLNFNFNILGNIAEDKKDGSGFTNQNNIIIDYDGTTRKVTLTVPVGQTFDAKYKGVVIDELVPNWVSPAHADVTATYYLYYDGTQFQFNTTGWATDFSVTQIAVVQYDAVAKTGLCTRECHGFMEPEVHKSHHFDIGTTKLSGGAISNVTLNSTTATHRRPYVADTTLRDEDLESLVNALSTNSYCQRRLTGTAENGTRTFQTAQTEFIKLSTNQPYWNEWTGSTWQDTLMTNNYFAAVFIVAIPAAHDANSQLYRLMWVQPQMQSPDFALIDELTSASLKHGEPSALVAEYNFIGKIIIKYIGGDWQVVKYETINGNRVMQSASPPSAQMTSLYFSYSTDVAASTADKGTFASGNVLTGQIIDLILTAGNTNATPTITIGTTLYSISGMPTVAKITESANQTYRLQKTADTTLTFVQYPDYKTEYGNVDTANGDWVFEKWASGKAECWTLHNIGSITIDAASTTIEGTVKLYYEIASIGHNYPFTFTAVKSSLTNLYSNGGGTLWIASNASSGGSTTVAPSIVLGSFTTTAPTMPNVVLSNHTIGTW